MLWDALLDERAFLGAAERRFFAPTETEDRFRKRTGETRRGVLMEAALFFTMSTRCRARLTDTPRMCAVSSAVANFESIVAVCFTLQFYRLKGQ